MKKKTSYYTLCTGILVFSMAITMHKIDAADSKPNIILCMADDQGWGDVAYNAHPHLKTPVLDEMAAQGLRFDNFYAAAPVCSPTRGSVLTGRHPNRFACFAWGKAIRPAEVTIAEALHKAGYVSGHFGKWHLGSVKAESPLSPGNNGFDEWFSSPNFYENSPLFSHRGQVVSTDGESSLVTVQPALEFMQNAVKQDKPFLAVIWFGNPHTPHVALDELKALYKDHPAKLQNYYGEITGIDQAMGHLRKSLKEMKIANDTLLWYTSDNGARPPGSTGGLRGIKGQLWEGGIRVPSIIEWPAVIKSPAITRLPGNTVDIYPTVLDIAGVEIPHQPVLDGVSLKPLLTGQEMKKRKPFGFWVYPAKGNPMRSRDMLTAMKNNADKTEPREEIKTYSKEDLPGHAAWVHGDFKLHHIPEKKNGNSNFRYELYNLKTDPHEKTDIAEQHSDLVKRLQVELEEWQHSVIDSLNRKDYPSGE